MHVPTYAYFTFMDHKENCLNLSVAGVKYISIQPSQVDEHRKEVEVKAVAVYMLYIGIATCIVRYMHTGTYYTDPR